MIHKGFGRRSRNATSYIRRPMTHLCLKHSSSVGIHKLVLNSDEADGLKVIYSIGHGRSTYPNIVGPQKFLKTFLF